MAVVKDILLIACIGLLAIMVIYQRPAKQRIAEPNNLSQPSEPQQSQGLQVICKIHYSCPEEQHKTFARKKDAETMVQALTSLGFDAYLELRGIIHGDIHIIPYKGDPYGVRYVLTSEKMLPAYTHNDKQFWSNYLRSLGCKVRVVDINKR